jgi:acylphosphatase
VERKRVHLVVHGRVQGVSFRESTRVQAGRIGVTGWVRNRPEGTVEIVAEGEAAQLEEFIKWVDVGPSAARVDRVEAAWAEGTGEFAEFRVTR